MFESENTNIKYVVGKLNSQDLYALPSKRHGKANIVQEAVSDDEEKCDGSERKGKDTSEEKDLNKDLPFGWEKHEDNDGPYYWHIKSGTIQREPPLWPKGNDAREPQSPTTSNASPVFAVRMPNGMPPEMIGSSVTRSSTSCALDQEDERRRKEDLALKYFYD